MSRLLALLICAGAASAHAQWLDSSWRLFVSGGAAARSRHQTLMTREKLEIDEAAVEVVSPTNLHLSGAVFPHRFFGLNVEGRGEFFSGCCDARLPIKRDPNDASTGLVPLPAADASLAAIGRARPFSWLGLELHLGAQFLFRTAVDVQLMDFSGQQRRAFIGPMFGGAVVVAPSRGFQGMLFVRFSPEFGLGASGSGITANMLAVGAQLSIGALRLGPLQAGLGPTVEFVGGTALADAGDGAERQFSQTDLRFGLGVTLQQWVEERVVPPPEVKGPLAGRVVLQDGAPAVDARVTLDGDATRATTTDLQGRFTFLAVAAGPHRLDATREGATPASAEVTTPLTGELVVTLGAPTGPGRIVGVVKQASGPVAGATVTTVGEPVVSVKSGADGSYALEKVGPGPVTVRVKADDFNDAEEVAQVSPAGVATLDFAMTPKAVAVQATLRGLIRAKSGEAVKATVRVVELKLKLQVKADGRFSADVPSGKYTLVIEARGYVTQTKTVEVSGGDQAIFHTELERSR